MTLADRATKVAPGDYTRAAQVYWHALGVSAQALSTSPPPDSELDDADEAQKILERKFPGIDAVAHIGTKKWADAKRKAAKQQPAAKPKAQRPPKAPKPPSPTRPPRGGRGRGRTRAFAGGYLLGRRRALEATRLPGAVRTTSANLMYALGAIVFLAIVYDVLRAGKAPALFAHSVTGFLDRLVGLKDPLAPLAGNVEQGVHLGDPQGAAQNLTNVATNALQPLPKGVNIPGITPLVTRGRRPGTVVPVLPAHPGRRGARSGTKTRLPAHP